MIKKFLLSLCLMLSAPVFAATIYACACGTGSNGACVPGSNTAPYDTPAKAINTIAQWKTSFQALTAGSNIATCQGGAFDGVATGNMSNVNGTAANPVVINSYDDTARWVGGAGIRPKFNNTSAAAALSFNKGTPAHTEGLTIKDIEIVGDGVNTAQGILIGADTDYILIDNIKITGTSNAIQVSGGTLGQQAAGDGITQDLIIRNSTITNNRDNGILAGVTRTLIEKNTFDHNGTDVFDHDIYMNGTYVNVLSKTISSITGNGSTSTLTTATPHGIAVGSHITIAVTGSTSSGSGSFNVTGGYGGTVATVTGASTITYASTGTPSASVVGTYVVSLDVPVTQIVIRNNTLSNGNVGAEGLCNLAHIIFHGDYRNVLVENNLITEAVAPASGCSAIDFTSGSYSPPEDYEKFDNIIIRGNVGINMFYGIAVDLCRQCLIENNYMHISGASTSLGGISMRGKNFAPGTVGSSTLGATQQSPHQVTIRYNSVYMTSPSATSWGIALNGNIGDPLTGTLHSLYGNVVVLGSTATTATMCYTTQNLTLGMFTRKDYNSCYYLGASVPKWDKTSTLATVQAGGDADKSDLNSTFASTANVTTGQPYWTTPTTSPAISASSALIGGGHPTLGPRLGYGGVLRNQGLPDRGAYEYGATTIVPNSPTRINAQ